MKALKWLAILGALALAVVLVGVVAWPVLAQDDGPLEQWARGRMMGGWRGGMTGNNGIGATAAYSGTTPCGGAYQGCQMMGSYVPTTTKPYSGTFGCGGFGQGCGGLGMMGGDLEGMTALREWMLQTGGMHTFVLGGWADALGMTPDELNAQLTAGKTPAQLVQEQGLSQEQLAAAMQSAMRAGLDKAVADGVLTREQADLMLGQMAEGYGRMAGRMGGAGGFGRGGCRGHFAPPSK